MTLYNDATRIATLGLTLAFMGFIAGSASNMVSSMFNEPRGTALLPATGADAYTPEAVFSRAKRYFGVTTNPREAGYILPDGTMLDFSGRRFGASGGERTMDHREIAFAWPEEDSPGGFEGMRRVMNWGAIRFTIFGTTMVVDTAALLTPSQESTIDQAIRKYPDAVLVVEVDNHDLYQIAYRNFEYPFTGWRSFVKEKLSGWGMRRPLVAANIAESNGNYQSIERERLVPKEYQQEKEAAFKEVIEAVEGLDLDEDAFDEYLPLAIPLNDLQRIAEKYGWWAARLAESVCPYNDVACVEREARRFHESSARRKKWPK